VPDEEVEECSFIDERLAKVLVESIDVVGSDIAGFEGQRLCFRC
jgi:hypothetical protein